jgi:hypothetical protein
VKPWRADIRFHSRKEIYFCGPRVGWVSGVGGISGVVFRSTTHGFFAGAIFVMRRPLLDPSAAFGHYRTSSQHIRGQVTTLGARTQTGFEDVGCGCIACAGALRQTR